MYFQMRCDLKFFSPIWSHVIELPPRSIVVRTSARGAGGRGSIPDRVTPKMGKLGGLHFSAWRLALMS